MYNQNVAIITAVIILIQNLSLIIYLVGSHKKVITAGEKNV